MIGFPTTGPSLPAAAEAEAAAAMGGDGNDGAFAEMLARGLGGHLMGRFAVTGDDAGHGSGDPSQDSGTDADATEGSIPTAAAFVGSDRVGFPSPVIPVLPAAGAAVATAPATAGDVGTASNVAPGIPVSDVTPAAPAATTGLPITTTPQTSPGAAPHVPTAASASRVAQPGTQPSTPPATPGDASGTRVAPQPSIAADPSPPSPQAASPTVEPPVIHWSPSEAGRAATVAERSRGTELDAIRALDALETPAAVPRPAAAAGAGTTIVTAPQPQPQPAGGLAAIVERIVQAVEIQHHLPPPRAIAVDLPELDGVRLVVSIRGNGAVHVMPAPGTANPGVTPLLGAVADALTENGFTLASDADADRGRRHHDDADEPRPFRRPRRAPRRAGLRI